MDNTKLAPVRTFEQVNGKAMADKYQKTQMDKKRKQMFENFAIADLCLEVARIALITGIKGTAFKNPKMFQKIERIESLLGDVQKSELGKVVSLHADFVDVMTNEHAVQVYRLIDILGFNRTEKLEEYLDKLEEDYHAKKAEGSVESGS